MTKSLSLALPGNANNGTVALVERDRRKLRTNQLVMETSRRLFPRKTAIHLVAITGYSQRAVECWLSNSARIPSDAIASLLHCEFGREYLSAIMVDATPIWWRKAIAYFAAVDALSLQRAAKRRLREAVDADADLTAAIHRAESLLAGDPDFHRPQIDALRSMGGVPDRARTKTK